MKRYSVSDVKNNPEKIYVFGDNLIKKGFAGQAVIRVCQNTIGIPTKRVPSMRENSFFSDKRDELRAVVFALNKVRDALVEGKTIVLPEDGIGTGLAQMGERSPIIFKKMNEYLQKLNSNYMKKSEISSSLDENKREVPSSTISL